MLLIGATSLRHNSRIVCAFLPLVVAFTAGAYALTITHYSSYNGVMGISCLGETVAIGTWAGLLVYHDGQFLASTVAEGLPDNLVRSVVLVDEETLYAGPFGRPDSAQQVLMAKLTADSILLTDVTEGGRFSCAYDIMALGPDGSLWVADEHGLHRFDGSEWSDFGWPEGMTLYMFRHGSLCVDADGRVWTVGLPKGEEETVLLCFDGRTWQAVPQIEFPLAVGSDRLGQLWCTTTASLWSRSDGVWHKVDEGPVWSQAEVVRLGFDDEGRVWGLGRSLVIWDGASARLIKEAAGVSFGFGPPPLPQILTSFAQYEPGTVVLGTAGYGLIFARGNEFWRISQQNCFPGCWAMGIRQDSMGRVWVRTLGFRALGVFDSGLWHTVEAPWSPTVRGSATFAQGPEGSMWFRTGDGVANWREGNWEFFTKSNSPLGRGHCLATDNDGSIWFNNLDRDPPIARLQRFGWEVPWVPEPFLSNNVDWITVGPGNRRWFGLEQRGYAVFDGDWSELLVGRDLPCWGRIYFDLEGRPYLAEVGRRLFRLESDGWRKVLQAEVNHMQADAGGTIWCAAYDGLYFGDGQCWQRLSADDGLACDHLNYVFIDHNGDKWLGSENGVARLEDGGPAAQKVKLAVTIAPGQRGPTVLALATLFNADETMPALLWVGCLYNGRVLFYPDWSADCHPQRILLPAHSVKTLELLSLDYNSIPPGTYTLLASLSLLRGADFMIGARGDKVAWTAFEKR